MKKIDIKDYKALMIFTGSRSLDNALALENREYGYEDEHLGVLTKTKTNDSAWSYVSKEVFVETTPRYNEFNDLYKIAYTYINAKSDVKPQSEMYLDSLNFINFRYNFESDLNSDIENIKTIANPDIQLGLQSINNGLYNKQRYYASNNELEYITVQGIKYNWYGPGSVLNETYTGVTHDISNSFVSYGMNSHSVQASQWDETSQSYVLSWEIQVDPETGAETQIPVMTTQYSLKYLDSLYPVIADKVKDAAERHIEKYGDMSAYYLYDLNNRLSMVANSYSFGKSNIDIMLNYDGDLNNWYNNSIRLNLTGLTPESKMTFGIKMVEDYPIDMTINENETLLDNKADNYGTTDSVVTFNTLSNTDMTDVRIMAPNKIVKLDLTDISANITGDIDLNYEYDKKINYKDTVRTSWNNEKSHVLEEFILGNDNECQVTNVHGLSDLTNLKNVSIKNCNNFDNDLDFSTLDNLTDLMINGTNLSSVKLHNGNNINNVTILNTALNSLVLTDNVIETLNYTPTEDLTTLELNNVTINNYNEVTENDNIYNLVSDWITSLKTADKLTSGTVNYVDINGVNWPAAQLQMLYDLKKIELNEFTGNVKVLDGDSEVIVRKDYRKLLNLYGNNIVNNDNDLHFEITLHPNAFDVKFDIVKTVVTKTEDEEGNEIVNSEDVVHDTLICKINDDLSGNSFLDYLQDNKLENIVFTDYVNNNKKKIGLVYTLNHNFEFNKKSEKLTNLEVGDLLLYNINQLIVVTKSTQNINTNYIKLGKFEDLTKVSQLTTHEFDWRMNLSSLEIFEDDENN